MYKKIGTLLIAILFVFTVSACGSTPVSQDESLSPEQEAVNKTVNVLFGGIATGEYLWQQLSTGYDLSINRDTITPLLQVVSQNFSYEILQTKVKDNEASCIVKVQYPNLGSAFSEAANSAASAYASGKTVDIEAMTEALAQEYSKRVQNGEISIIETQFEIKLEKQHDIWTVQPDEELYNVLSGNLYSPVRQLIQLLGLFS